MKGTYKIAEHVIGIDSTYEYPHTLAAGYRTDEKPEFHITTSREEIENEKLLSEREFAVENLPPVKLPDENHEFTLIYRKICELLFPFDILLFHGSVVSVDNRAYMFIAKSGTGKSTHSRMWRELLGAKAVMVNDDKPLVKITEKQATAYGTPWNGKHRLGNNIAVPLKGICILKRGVENKIRKITVSEAYPMLLQQIYRIPDRLKLAKTMELLDTLDKSVGFYEMECNISTDAARMSYTFMSTSVSASAHP